MFQIRRIGFRIISLYLVSHDLHFPARTGGNRRDNRIQFIHLMQFVASHPYTLPFLIQNAEQTGGSVTLTSEPGKGTKVRAVFHSDHIDCPPWGDLPGTVALLITGNPEINVCFEYRSGETGYSISTNEIKEILDGVPLSHPKVMLLIKEMIKENIRS